MKYLSLFLIACTASVSVPGKDGRDGTNGKDGSPDTAQQVLDKVKSLDGAGSGLDADTLRGTAPSGFVTHGERIIQLPLGSFVQTFDEVGGPLSFLNGGVNLSQYESGISNNFVVPSDWSKTPTPALRIMYRNTSVCPTLNLAVDTVERTRVGLIGGSGTTWANSQGASYNYATANRVEAAEFPITGVDEQPGDAISFHLPKPNCAGTTIVGASVRYTSH